MEQIVGTILGSCELDVMEKALGDFSNHGVHMIITTYTNPADQNPKNDNDEERCALFH